MVTSTIVAGKILMQDRRILTLDVERISAKAREQAPRIWETYQTFVH
jgi:hypothetical protein